MKRTLTPFFLLLVAISLLTSCMKDDNQDVATYDDTAITSFTVANAIVTHYTKTTAGDNDSVYIERIAPTTIKFSIDQINKTIFNLDSLPYGTNASKLIITMYAKNGGTIAIKDKQTNDFTYYIATDTLDFSTPRVVRVYNGTSSNTYRDYNVSVNVHKEQADSFKWNKPLVANNDFANQNNQKLVCVGNKLFLFGIKDNATHIYTTNVSDGANWQEISANIELNESVAKNVVVKNNNLFSINNNNVVSSQDGTTWQTIANTNITNIIATDKQNLYGVDNNNNLYISVNNGETWTQQTIDANNNELPINGNFSFIANINGSSTMSNILAVGLNSLNKQVSWTKVVDYNQPLSNDYSWAFFGTNANNKSQLPQMSNLQVVEYNKQLLATGVQSNQNNITTLYSSRDNGFSWNVSSSIVLPQSAIGRAQNCAMCVDNDNHIWMVFGTTGEVYKGRLNKLGWISNK